MTKFGKKSETRHCNPLKWVFVDSITFRGELKICKNMMLKPLLSASEADFVPVFGKPAEIIFIFIFFLYNIFIFVKGFPIQKTGP